LCAIISVSVIFLSSNLVKQKNLKKFSIALFILKFFVLFTLFLLNKTGLNILIKFLVMIDYSVDVLIGVTIYPMISIIKKNDKLYAKKDLIYSFLYYIGAIIVSLILGKVFLGFKIDYNFYCLLGAISILGSVITLLTLDLNKYITIEEDKEENNMYDLLRFIKKDKISQQYLLFGFNSSVSYDAISVLMLTILVKNYNILPSHANILILVVGICSSLLGMLVMSLFTFKNNYINISIKYLTRTLLYIVTFISNFKTLFLIAILFTRLSSDSYGHISDAPYVNRIDNKYQFAFCNLKEMVGYLGVALGVFLSGLVISDSIRYIFLISSLFSTFQLIAAYRAIYLKEKEKVK
jgi:hypothetical protein